jgi:hypothetical protein
MISFDFHPTMHSLECVGWTTHYAIQSYASALHNAVGYLRDLPQPTKN